MPTSRGLYFAELNDLAKRDASDPMIGSNGPHSEALMQGTGMDALRELEFLSLHGDPARPGIRPASLEERIALLSNEHAFNTSPSLPRIRVPRPLIPPRVYPHGSQTIPGVLEQRPTMDVRQPWCKVKEIFQKARADTEADDLAMTAPLSALLMSHRKSLETEDLQPPMQAVAQLIDEQAVRHIFLSRVK